MSNNDITLATIYNFMVDKFEQIDKKFEQIDRKFEQIDTRFEQIDKRLDSIDARITRLAADNEEAHDKLSERITLCTNAILRLEQAFNDKISILFDAEQEK